MSSTQTVHTNGDDTTSKSTQQNGNQQEQYTKLKKSSEKLVIDVDLVNSAIVGYADLHVQPLEDITELSIHCSSQCKISAVSIKGEQVEPVDVIHQKLKKTQVKPKLSSDPKEAERQSALKNCVKELKWQSELDDKGLLNIRLRTPLTKDQKTILRIFFQLIKPRAGAFFVKYKENQLPHMFTHNQTKGARLWFPCLDTLSNFSTWSFEVTTHAEAMVICTGDLIKQVEIEGSNIKTAYFEQKEAIPAQGVCLAVGPFKVYHDPKLPFVNHFYLPHHNLAALKHTVSFIGNVFKFYEEFSGVKYTDLFKSYKQVFVENAYEFATAYSTISIISSDLILEESIIENTMETRCKIAQLIASQYFGNFVYPKTWADLWLIIGLSGYFGLRFLQKEFGKNELRYFIMTEAKQLLQMDTHVQPLYCDVYISPSELLTPLLHRKAPLVIYMIERLISMSNMKKLVNKFLAQALVNKNDIKGRSISTKELLKTVKKTYGMDLKHFAEYWIYSTGIPYFHCGFRYDVGRSVVEFAVKQSGFGDKKFTGNVTVRIHETEGTYDYVVPVEDDVNYCEFPIRSKPRKKQRKKMLEEGNLSKPRIEIPIKWIRVDPDLDWVRVITFRQTETMWMNQLEKDRDVIAQYEAVQALRIFNTSQNALTKLEHILYDKCLYYRIRIEAAYSIAMFSQPPLKMKALELLIKYFKTRFYDKRMTYVKPNDFSDISEYYIQKEIPLTLVLIRNEQGFTPDGVVEFILELITTNDNSENKFCADYYIGNLVKALGKVNIKNNEKILQHVRRFLVMDSLLPSHQQIITRCALASLADMISSGRAPLDIPIFFDYTKHGNIHFVRLAALHALLRICSSTHPKVVEKLPMDDVIMQIIDVIEGPDETPLVRDMFARTLAQICAKPRPNRGAQSALTKFIAKSREPNKDNIRLVERLWGLIHGPYTEFDSRLRADVIKLYNAFWGPETPPCLATEPPKQEIKPELEEHKPKVEEVKAQQTLEEPKKKEKKRKAEERLEKKKKKKKKKEEKKEKKLKVKKPKDVMSSKVTIKVGGQASVQRDLEQEREEKERMEREEQERLAQEEEILFAREKYEQDKKKMLQQKVLEEKLEAERLEKGECDRIIIIHCGDNTRLYCKLYNTPTAEAIYRSLPLEANVMTGIQGMVYFPCPGMEKVTIEPGARQLVRPYELAYWVAGNSICIGYGRTEYTLPGTNDIRLYEPCNIFGILLYPNRNIGKTVGQPVRVERPRRAILDFPTENFKTQLELYCSNSANYVWNMLPIRSAIEIFGECIYFAANGGPTNKPGTVRKSSDDMVRDAIAFGEICYWVSGDSIIIGSGKTPRESQNPKFPVKLIEPCYVFGRVVSNVKLIPSKSKPWQVIMMYKRNIKITIGEISFIAQVMDTLTGDAIYSSLPIESTAKVWGEEVYFNIKLPHTVLPEPNMEKIVVDIGELAFWTKESAICIGYGKTPASKQNECRLASPCNIWARVDEDTDLKDLFSKYKVKDGDKVKIEPYIDLVLQSKNQFYIPGTT